MEIKEAVRIIKETDESEMESLSNAILIEKAETKIMDCIKNGYTLCKADEAVEQIKVSENNVVRKWIKPEKAIEIIKEACK